MVNFDSKELYGNLYQYLIVKLDLNEKNQSPLSNVISLGGWIKKLWIARTDWLSEFHVRECIITFLDKSRSDEIRGETVGN